MGCLYWQVLYFPYPGLSGTDGAGPGRQSAFSPGVDTHDTTEKPDGRKKLEDKEILREAEIAAGLYEKIYREARSSQALDSLATKDKILKKLGDAGYSAVDWDNQLEHVQF